MTDGSTSTIPAEGRPKRQFALSIALFSFFSLVGMAAGSWPQNPDAARPEKQRDLGLPELHRINLVTLQPSYSCRSREEFQKGYEQTALFVSSFSRKMNTPDLLFNGGCEATDSFQAATSGDDMSLLEDMGKVPLEDVIAQSVFLTHGLHFEKFVDVHLDHTYAVLVNNPARRALIVFTVTGYVLNRRVDLKYAVKEYQILNVQAQSSGFDWGKGNL